MKCFTYAGLLALTFGAGLAAGALLAGGAPSTGEPVPISHDPGPGDVLPARAPESAPKPPPAPAPQESAEPESAQEPPAQAQDLPDPLPERARVVRRRLFGSLVAFEKAEAEAKETWAAENLTQPKIGEDPMLIATRQQEELARSPFNRSGRAERLEAYLLAQCGGDRDLLAQLLHDIRQEFLAYYAKRGRKIPSPGLVGGGSKGRIFDLLCR